MRAISIKAVIIANLANLVIAGVLACIVITGTLVGAWLQHGAPEDIDDITAALKSSAFFLSLTWAFALIPATIGAGYLAGRIAGRHYLLNGALSSAVWILMTLYELVHGAPSGSGVQVPKVLAFVFDYGTPLFGALGGYLARELDARRAAAGTALTPLAGAIRSTKTATRWFVALVAATAAYITLLKLAAAVGSGHLGPVFAVALSIMLAAAVVPARHRRAAGFVFIGLAILLPTAEWIRYALFDASASVRSFYVFLNTVGAALAFTWLKSIFPAQFPSKPGGWWWLTTLECAQWSARERRVSTLLFLIAFTSWFLLFLLTYRLLGWAGVAVAAPIAALLSMLPAFFAARPIATLLFPDLIRHGDANAAVRLAASAAGEPARS